jgi:hypothetical protein
MFGFNQWRQLLARGEGNYFKMVVKTTYEQVNNYVIQQSVLMTKWIEEYESQNQLYLYAIKLWSSGLENYPRDSVMRS